MTQQLAFALVLLFDVRGSVVLMAHLAGVARVAVHGGVTSVAVVAVVAVAVVAVAFVDLVFFVLDLFFVWDLFLFFVFLVVLALALVIVLSFVIAFVLALVLVLLLEPNIQTEIRIFAEICQSHRLFLLERWTREWICRRIRRIVVGHIDVIVFICGPFWLLKTAVEIDISLVSYVWVVFFKN